MRCRHCNAELNLPFLDLGSAPYSNAIISPKNIDSPESWFPLRAFVCTSCWLVQTMDTSNAAALFTEQYAYFSSFSTTWLQHAQTYVTTMINRFNLNQDSLVIELGANDGYLLQYFNAQNIPSLGVEPTRSTAESARAKGVEIVESFFGTELASSLLRSGRLADLITANNVLAHVPDINDFLLGVSLLLKPTGVATFEFPHLLRTVLDGQFDTIYHEHFSYLSLTTLNRILKSGHLRAFDVEKLDTHGGSLRVYVQKSTSSAIPQSHEFNECLRQETIAGMQSEPFYSSFQEKANTIKNDFLMFLLNAKKSGKSVAGYGAAAKGNTLLNYAGIRPDLLPFVVDRNPAKQGRHLPGSRIPVFSEKALAENKPDYIVIFPWNLSKEIIHQLAYVREWGGKFVLPIPTLEIR